MGVAAVRIVSKMLLLVVGSLVSRETATSASSSSVNPSAWSERRYTRAKPWAFARTEMVRSPAPPRLSKPAAGLSWPQLATTKSIQGRSASSDRSSGSPRRSVTRAVISASSPMA
jgi:hypothetical protein